MKNYKQQESYKYFEKCKSCKFRKLDKNPIPHYNCYGAITLGISRYGHVDYINRDHVLNHCPKNIVGEK